MNKLTKQETAEYLGVSTRAVERYTKKDLLHVDYDDQRRALYNEQEVKALKQKMDVPRQPATTAIARRGDLDLPALVEAISRAVSQAKTEGAAAPDLQRLALKLVLTLDEAAAYTGLPKSQVVAAARLGKLKRLPGRVYRFKRVDLEMYVKKL